MPLSRTSGSRSSRWPNCNQELSGGDMFRISVLCFFSVAALAQPPWQRVMRPEKMFPPAIAWQQIMSGSGTLKSGVTIRFKTVATPAGIDWSGLGEGGISTDANSIHRDMIDKRSGTYFGYDLV